MRAKKGGGKSPPEDPLRKREGGRGNHPGKGTKKKGGKGERDQRYLGGRKKEKR